MKPDDTWRVWVDLDTLLDTRLATLCRIDPELVPVCLSNRYLDRPIDDWEYMTNNAITRDTFDEAYRDRDKDTLKEAVPTQMVEFLGKESRRHTERRLTSAEVNNVEVVVNIWPYDFTEAEKTTLIAMVAHYLGEETDITVERQPLEYLTPRLLRDSYSAVVTYEFNEWFRIHHQELDKGGCPRVTIYGPELFLKEIPDPDTVKEELADFTTQDPFRLLEMSVVTRFNLQLLPAWYFSAIDLTAAKDPSH